MADALAAIGVATPYPRPLAEVPRGPRAPAELEAASGDGTATLRWTDPPGADHEVVWLRDVSAVGPWPPLSEPVAGGFLQLDDLVNGHAYDVRLQAVKGYWPAEGVWSDVARLRPLPPLPGRARLSAAWSPRTDRVRVVGEPVPGATSYRVDVDPSSDCSTRPSRFTTVVEEVSAPRAVFRTRAPYVRVRLVARNLAGTGRPSVPSACLRVR
jgi:hypothetical protein